MNLNKQFLFGALTGIGGLGLKTVLNIVVYPVILSSLGGTKFGLYVLLLGIVELLIALDLGFTSGLTQRLSTAHAHEDLDETRQFLSTGLVLYLVITALVLMTSFFVPGMPHFLNIDANLTEVATFCLYIIIIEGALTLFQGYFAAVLQANCKYQCVNTSETLYYLISNGGIFVLLYFGMGLKEITMLRLAAAVLKFGMIFLHCVRTQPGSLDFKYCNLEKAKKLLQISIHSMIKNVSDIMAGRVDLIVISKFLTLQDVGLYEFTFRFLNLAIEFPAKFAAGVYPIFTRLHVKKEIEQSRLLFIRLSSILYLGINMTILLLFLFYKELFMFFARGHIRLEESWPIFLLGAPAIIHAALYLPANHYLFASGQHRYVSFWSIIMAIAKLASCIILVKLYGLPGVVLSTIVIRCPFYQFVIIQKACKDLAISLIDYFRDVHLKMALPVSAIALILWLVKTSGLFSGSLFLNLLACSSLAFTAGFIIWFLTTASEFETKYISNFFEKFNKKFFKNRLLNTSN